MDEETRQLAVRIPADLVFWLESVAEARGWKLSRAVRWALRETYDREHTLAEAAALRADPSIMPRRRMTAQEAFSPVPVKTLD
jgi:hypothetical protein